MATVSGQAKGRSTGRKDLTLKEKFELIQQSKGLNTTVSFVTLLIARTARIACADRHTHTHTYIHTHTHTQEDYCNPLCACAPRVNYSLAS